MLKLEHYETFFSSIEGTFSFTIYFSYLEYELFLCEKLFFISQHSKILSNLFRIFIIRVDVDVLIIIQVANLISSRKLEKH